MRVTVVAPGTQVTALGSVARAVAVGGGGSVTVSGVGTQGPPGPVSPKAVALEWPMNGEEVTLCYVPWAVTLAVAHAVIVGDPDAVVAFALMAGPTRDGVGAVSVADCTVDASPGGTELTVTAPDVGVGFVWIAVTGVTGLVRELHVTVWF